MEVEWIKKMNRTEIINKLQNKKLFKTLIFLIIGCCLVMIASLIFGKYGIITPKELYKVVLYWITNNDKYYSINVNIIQYIRLPRMIAAFLVGSSLAVAGLVYQNTFNNNLISPDLLGVNAGCCVGAGIAILIGLSNVYVSLFAFVFGVLSVLFALLLDKMFGNKASVTLVLSGIIVGSFMNSIVGIIKYMADKEDKLSSITFWMMGSLSGIKLNEIIHVIIIVTICLMILYLMSSKLDAISLGYEDATSIGLNYRLIRLIIIVCSTLLTTTTVSISGSVGWVGLIIPHISRFIIRNRSKDVIPVCILFGGIFMILVDMFTRLFSIDEIPLSIITGLLGALIYAIVLIKKGKSIYE